MVDDAPRILANRYEVGELIGRGGMAEVHIGHDTRLGRTVAIKILRSDLARDPSFQARFRREAQAAASLNHPSVVAVYDTGEDVITAPTGAVAHVPFIVMEYVEGHTVRHILGDGQAVPIEEAVEITAGVLSALEYSHHAGIVHRDIKPANVMLTPTGAVKVMDFGIARALADSAATMTQTQAVLGTAQYLSPEQARGEQVDARSDLYSTGCLLFELLTGRPPFTGDSQVAVAYQHVREPAPAPSTYASDVPEVLDRITLKALAKERDSRYSSAAEFRSDLESAARGGRVAAPALGVLAATAAAEAAAAPATELLTPLAGPSTQVMPASGGAWPHTAASPATAAAGAPVATRPDPPKRRRGLVWALVLIGLAAIATIATLAVLDRRDTAAETVAVPNLVDMTREAAQAELEIRELTMEPIEEPDDDVEAGRVIRTDPGAGEAAAVGSAVTVWISAGPGTAEVPEVAGMTQEQASRELRDAGFEVGSVEFENAPRVDRNEVTKTVPAAGEQHPRNTPVVLYVASGQVDLPDLVGRTRADALAALEELGLSSTITEEESDAEPDTVIAQGRSAGQVPQTTSVALTIAVAPTTATVPSDLVGATYDDAAAQLTALGLTPVRVDVESDQPVGQVISSDPNRGTTVQLGSEVTLNVSAGAEDEEGDTNAGSADGVAPAGTGAGAAAPVRTATGTATATRAGTATATPAGTATGTATRAGTGTGTAATADAARPGATTCARAGAAPPSARRHRRPRRSPASSPAAGARPR
ncbi:Stk1 family PASTA domain-containing Ser/Thr kinase [Cellulomonas sp. ATA003]|uniref:Stk1 family PASTA domain-containing Ser/Thr kinase n=1 Tax=Cellulomonas sp. ATA003 TaxID=3073064 RepID=UPI002872FA0A|nr:Stk1 family PASTA domain-containing Ser/Thr kinase [Cellulomonas sp. ATA003]WNB85576.1 Stk1 family PASTA domain-containing Ser/Thr kinase [Cellulomonas sp. ATA003]